MDTRWARTWKPDDSKPSGDMPRQDSLSNVLQTLTSLTSESHSPTHTREGFVTVLQSMCSHGHKLQFGDVQQAFNTGDPIKRTEPSSSGCRLMESQESLVVSGCSCLKQSMDWLMAQESGRNCFLAAARGLGFETSVLEPCVLALRNTQQNYHGIVGVAVDDIAGGGDEVWEQAISKLKQRFRFRTLGSGKSEHFAVVRWCTQQMDPCVLGNPALHQEPGLCAPWEIEKGTIRRCQRERKKLP